MVRQEAAGDHIHSMVARAVLKSRGLEREKEKVVRARVVKTKVMVGTANVRVVEEVQEPKKYKEVARGVVMADHNEGAARATTRAMAQAGRKAQYRAGRPADQMRGGGWPKGQCTVG